MDQDQASRELAAIRQLMERPVRFSTASGLSGILAGLAALCGVAADSYVCRQFGAASARWMNLLVWAGVFIVAFVAAVVLTRIREAQRGMAFWSPVKRRILRTILPPFIAGAGLTAVIVARWHLQMDNQWGLIPAIWMLCYGLALWQVGEFSILEMRLLGLTFLLAGLVAAGLAQDCPYWAMGITFGGFHIMYGAIVWIRHGG
jgi:hypothetical protein